MNDTQHTQLSEDEKLKTVRDERSARLNQPPLRKFRKLYRFAEEWFEHAPEKKSELKKLISEVEKEEAQELSALKKKYLGGAE